jgi:hypothetical protein
MSAISAISSQPSFSPQAVSSAPPPPPKPADSDGDQDNSAPSSPGKPGPRPTVTAGRDGAAQAPTGLPPPRPRPAGRDQRREVHGTRGRPAWPGKAAGTPWLGLKRLGNLHVLGWASAGMAPLARLGYDGRLASGYTQHSIWLAPSPFKQDTPGDYNGRRHC